MPLRIVDGDLLNASEQYIAHQCNCVATKPHGISTAIFKKFPYANVYKSRLPPRCTCSFSVGGAVRCKCARRDLPGTIDVHPVPGRGGFQRGVINMIAQVYPGTARFKGDLPLDRVGYFQQCLDKIAEIPKLHSVAFPYRIGCGLAGGDWDMYLSMLEKFSESVNTGDRCVKVVVYQLPEKIKSSGN
jgi:O-acetyl-ADP-ribose deacetylase (regulator of RNase III)